MEKFMRMINEYDGINCSFNMMVEDCNYDSMSDEIYISDGDNVLQLKGVSCWDYNYDNDEEVTIKTDNGKILYINIC